MKNKTRIQKQKEYDQKYSDIPKDYKERLEYMYDKYNLNEKKAQAIIDKRNNMLEQLHYDYLQVILYEVPEGYKRNRFRLVNRKNLINEAISNSNFVHVYSPGASEDRMYMHRLIESELLQLNDIIYTPCNIHYRAFLPTPSAYNIEDTFLSEIGLERPINKPDADNISKKYMDMYNEIIYQDDSLVCRLLVDKYYSTLPRLEINLYFLNMLYNKYQYNSMCKRLPNKNLVYFK